jgi:4-alpha-glucanotransferase
MNERSAGILLHITSLASEFGIGDLGPQAYAFADMLARCDQKIWQILPLNFVDAVANFSPYSSVSSAAGNILLISPELLVKDELLKAQALDQFRLHNNGKVNFEQVVDVKNKIFDAVWEDARQKKENPVWKSFRKFCLEEEWLDDFSLYSIIKEQQGQKPWFQWPADLKKRKAAGLQKISREEKDAIQKAKFLQFIFARQWQRLKTHCNDKGIKILGDLPYYVSRDSVDAWTNPEIFKIDNEGEPLAVAGTPPDMFSKDGQLWNMPVYRWKVLKKENYEWWVERISRNKKLFDLIRLDHFRGFSAYWEVPAKEPTARNGSWKEGPGAGLLKTIKKKLGDMPFVAEDLGEIDDAVIKLKDQFNLPGMKVLQFAFGENMANSEHIPHHYGRNFFVFTGTHDNNTTRGWWRNDINEDTKIRIREYCDKDLTEETVAREFIRLAYASTARAAIVPMQDILNLDESARMNTPGTVKNNWSWSLQPGQLTGAVEDKLKQWVRLYKR